MAIHISSSPGGAGAAFSLVDDGDDDGEEGKLLGEMRKAGEGTEDDVGVDVLGGGSGHGSFLEDPVPRVDRVWEEHHHGALRSASGRKSADRPAAVCLLATALFALGALIFSLGKGEIEVMERVGGRGGYVGEGLLQVSHQKAWVFGLVPLQSAGLGLAWVLLLRARARAVLFATILVTPLVVFATSVYVITHASKHDDLLLLGTGCFGILWAFAFTAGACRKDSLTPTLATEASFRLWGAWAGRGVLLVTATMMVSTLFLWAACTACAAHLWSVPDGSGEALRAGPRYLLPFLVAACAWLAAWLDSVLRFTVSCVVTGRYFAPATTGVPQTEGALEGLHTAVASYHAPLARGSALVSAARILRTAQLGLEGVGERGKTAVGLVCGAFPVLLPSVYVGPHAYVILAQGSRGGFMAASKEAFKLLARNGLSSAADSVARAPAFAGVRAVGSCFAVLSVGLSIADDKSRYCYVTVALVALVSDAVVSRLTSLPHFAMEAVLVCYAQDVEACRPSPPSRCSTALHGALEENTVHERMSEESAYATDRVAAFGGDQL